MVEKVRTEFKKRFGGDAAVYAAPGRVNLIGEHTDYNMGFVLPGAIDKAIYAAIRPNGGINARIYSIDYDSEIDLDLDGGLPQQQWAKYIYGVVRQMRERGATIEGFDCVFGGDIPLGAGLSSSAALENAFSFGLNELFGAGFPMRELAVIGQMTEHNYVGVKCGIMDQFASLFGKAGQVIKLDCRSLEYEPMPFAPDRCRLVLIDSMVKHSLASSEYNIRRMQCEQGVEVVAKHVKGIESLRDVTMEMLEQYKAEMEPVVFRRCSYVINENKRLTEGCAALQNGNYHYFGKMMYGSHEGLSKQYEVSCEELDFIVDIARTHQGVLGARMMGGGFGGCVISLVENTAYDDYISDVAGKFEKRFGLSPKVIDVVIGNGTRKVE